MNAADMKGAIDLLLLTIAALLALLAVAVGEVRRLRAGIRAHRDARGNDRCWLDDEVLYRLLPDHEALTVLPDRATFLANCAAFHANRQHPYHLQLFHCVHPGGATPPREDPR